ncbi:MAG: DUF2905 domain-containing protein [Candidatus Omnitrophica bacterium]|nr:DUF2905 domain-containing protein [Candidatus Omnitrophota bacterium]
MQELAKILIILGSVIIILGLVLLVAHKIPFLGRLPGDILIERKNFTFYFPLTTSLLLSLLLTIIFWIWSRRQ